MKKILYLLLFVVLLVCGDRIADKIIRHGVYECFGLNQHAKLLLIGHSHMDLATDKLRIEDSLQIKISKYTRPGVNVVDRYQMIRQYFDSPYADSVKCVFYGVDLFTFQGSGLSQHSYKLFYPFLDDQQIDRYVKSQASFGDYWVHKLLCVTRYTDDAVYSSIIGWRHKWANLKDGVLDTENYKRKLSGGNERKIGFNAELMDEFDKTIKFLTDKGIRVILVNTPTCSMLNANEPEAFARITRWYQDYADKNELVEYWDFNEQYASDHSIFFDAIHLNKKGEKIITDELIEKLQNTPL